MRSVIAAGVLVALSACAPKEVDEPIDTSVDVQDVSIAWEARFGDEVARCGATYPGIGSTGVGLRYDGARLYVHDIRVIFEDGTEAPFEMDDRAPWQDGAVALLDFEDGSESCTMGDAGTNLEITGSAPVERANADETARVRAVGLAFVMGVPFDPNHSTLEAASPPLDVAAMNRNPTSGRIFFRLDATGPNTTDWPVLLNSTGCTAQSGQAPTCGAENLVHYAFDAMDLQTDTVVVDIAALLETSNVSTNATFTSPGGTTIDTPTGCQSDANDADCSQIFVRYGAATSPSAFVYVQ